MGTPPAAIIYKNHRFPVEIISHAVWLYFRFCLSFRDVEELLLERGVLVTYEAIRKWCRKFGQQYANQLRRRRPRPAISGIWMRCFSRSRASITICGGQ
jgi:putative transposase